MRILLIVTASASIGCASPAGIPVSAAQSGEAWPFTIASGTLRCSAERYKSPRLLVTLDTGDGIEYGLNGTARQFGFPDGMKILKHGKTGADLQPFITRGLMLCAQ